MHGTDWLGPLARSKFDARTLFASTTATIADEDGLNGDERWGVPGMSMLTAKPSHRLWYPLDATLPVEDGFLSPIPNDRGATLQSLAAVPCLVLLGAPGMGKSHEARVAIETAKARGDAVDLLEAPRHRNPGQAMIDLLNGERASSWRRREGDWELLVDGLDELEGGAAAFIQHLRTFLEHLIARGGDLNNFRLRLFCRTIEWVEGLDDTLSTVWAAADQQKRQLAPFQEAEVLDAAGVDLGNPTALAAFMEAIAHAHVQALAARPVSYRMLVNLFGRHNTLPAKQADLYLQGLRALLIDTTRRRAGPTAGEAASEADETVRVPLDPDRLTILAGRIALAMAMSGSSAITVGESRPGALSLDQLATGKEPSPPHSFRVRIADLLDVIRSPLFTGSGSDTWIWSHQTFMEFLAARYLIDHEIEPLRLLSLLSVEDPGSDRLGVVPQFREIAAWTAAMSPAIFNELVEREPDILLQSDVASAEDGMRARLVTALLDRLDSGELETFFWQLRPYFDRLDHPGLADQLRAVIFDASVSFTTRRGALDIAEENHVRTFVPQLAGLAGDPNTHIALRRAAAGAVLQLGDDDEKGLLAGLLNGDQAATLDDEIRGPALMANWPGRLTVPRLLAALTPPQDPHLIGTYAMFLYRFEPGALTTEDALAVFAWLDATLESASDSDRDSDPSDRGVRSKLLWAAVAQAVAPEVRHAFARLILHAFDQHASFLFGSDLLSERVGSPEIRVAVVVEVLAAAADAGVASRYLIHFAQPLLVQDDLPLYLEQIESLEAGTVKRAFADLVVNLAGDDLDRLGDLWKLAQADVEVGEAWLRRHWVALDSPAVEWMRSSEARQRKAEERQFDRTEVRERADARLLSLLQQSETDPSLWWQLNLQLFVSDQGDYRADLEHQSDLTDAPGWKRLTEADQQRVIDGADRYLRDYRLETLRWLGTNTQHRPASAGYRAARLLLEHRTDAFYGLDNDVWRAWTPALLSFFDNNATAATTVQQRIVAHACSCAREAIVSTLVRLAWGPHSQGLSARLFEVLKSAYDTRLGDVLAGLRGPKLKGEKTDALIVGFLVERDYPPIIDQTLSILASRAAGWPDDPDQASDLAPGTAEAAAQLILNGRGEAWSSLTSLRALDPDAARAIWNAAASAYGVGHSPSIQSVSEGLLSRAYLDLDDLFPDRPEPFDSARFLSTADYVERLRDSILNELVGRGTANAVQALERLAQTAAGGSDIRFRIPEARRTFRAETGTRDPVAVLETIALMSREYPEQREAESVRERQPAPPVREVPSEPSVAIAPDASPTAGLTQTAVRPIKILTVATEWRSGHGGISTVNRELCIAMAAQGHIVQCAVVSASTDELIHAGEQNVQLVECPKATGVHGAQKLLMLRPAAFGQAPDIVVGHDQITGPYALHLAGLFERPYVHFLHTVPEEIEPLKDRTRNNRGGFYRGADKRIAQKELCAEASLVVGIGPRIFGHIPSGSATATHEMIPGLNSDLIRRQFITSRQTSCLITGRMEDGGLKGLGVAAKAVLRVRSDPNSGLRIKPRLTVRGLDPTHGEEELSQAGLEKEELDSFVNPRPFTSDAMEIHADFDRTTLFVMPSKVEGFGLTGYEAIAAGIPVLISEESGLADLMKTAEGDNLIDPGFIENCIVEADAREADAELRWASRIASTLGDVPGAVARAAEIRARLTLEFTWDKAAASLGQKLEMVLGQCGTDENI